MTVKAHIQNLRDVTKSMRGKRIAFNDILVQQTQLGNNWNKHSINQSPELIDLTKIWFFQKKKKIDQISGYSDH